MKYLISKLMSTYDTCEMLDRVDDAIKFRVETHQLQSENTFITKFYRYELFRLQPTCPQDGGKPVSEESDEVVPVEDHLLNQNLTIDNSLDGCLQKTEQLLADFEANRLR